MSKIEKLQLVLRLTDYPTRFSKWSIKYALVAVLAIAILAHIQFSVSVHDIRLAYTNRPLLNNIIYLLVVASFWVVPVVVSVLATNKLYFSLHDEDRALLRIENLSSDEVIWGLLISVVASIRGLLTLYLGIFLIFAFTNAFIREQTTLCLLSDRGCADYLQSLIQYGTELLWILGLIVTSILIGITIALRFSNHRKISIVLSIVCPILFSILFNALLMKFATSSVWLIQSCAIPFYSSLALIYLSRSLVWNVY